MFQIGDSLREARVRRGLTPDDVHKAVRIRERYLTALEEERWDMLPGEAYTKGFLRTYSDYLGLDGQLYVDEYNARIARHDDDAAPAFVAHASVAEGRVLGRGILVALAAIVVVGAVVGGLAAWRLGGSSTPPRTDGNAAAATTRNTVSLHSKKTTKPKSKPKPVVARPVLTSIAATRGRCWLLVRTGGPNGAVAYEGTLEQGEVKTFHFASRLWVRMGDPTSVDVTLAGKPVTGLPSSPSNVLLTRAGAIIQ